MESTNGIAAKSESEKWNECLPSTGEGDILADVGREAELCKSDTGPPAVGWETEAAPTEGVQTTPAWADMEQEAKLGPRGPCGRE